jgi:hypothetical protein
MNDARLRKPPCSESVHSFPIEAMPLTTAEQTTSPKLNHPFSKHLQAVDVAWYRMVVEVAVHNQLEPLPCLRHRIMHPSAKLLFDLPQLRPHALADRLAPYSEVSVPVFPADMRESQKVECFWLTLPSSFPFLFGKPPELDPARLIRVKLQPKLLEPFPEILQETIQFGPVLEAKNAVVGVSDDDHVPVCILLAPHVRPEIEDIVQIDVGK